MSQTLFFFSFKLDKLKNIILYDPNLQRKNIGVCGKLKQNEFAIKRISTTLLNFPSEQNFDLVSGCFFNC